MKAVDDSVKTNGFDSRPNESLVQQNAMLRQKLEEEHSNYKRKLQAYQDGQQRQAQLIQKLQSKVCIQNMHYRSVYTYKFVRIHFKTSKLLFVLWFISLQLRGIQSGIFAWYNIL